MLLAAGSPVLAHQSATAPALGSAASFVVLGHASVTNTGPTRVTGNVGVSPGNVVTGLSSSMFSVGDIRRDDALARKARIDSDAAGVNLVGQQCTRFLDPELGGKTLSESGVYCFTAQDVQLDGPLILAGDRNTVWIFRIAGTLTIGSDASVLVTGNGYDGNVFWWTGGAVTLGARSTFIGNIFAGSNITLGNGASLSGRVFARSGSVTLDSNKVSLCCAPLLLAPATLPDGSLGTPYRQMVTASGGMAPYTFAVSSGSLPFGLVLASDGTLQGIPALLGTFDFTVTATDALGCSSSAAYSIRIDCGPREVLPPATVGVEYAVPLTFDGIPPFTCSNSAGMPPGLSVPNCIVSGTPDATGTFDFVVESTDAAGARRSLCLILTVGECPIVFPDPPPGTACELYTHTFRASGGTPPYTFTAPDGTLPPGWTLSTTGTLSGTTSAAGTYIVPVTATDALSRSCSRTYTIPVICPLPDEAPVILPDGEVCDLYNETIKAPVCGGPPTITGVTGDVPPGLVVKTNGVVHETPARPGTYHFVVTWRTANMCTTTQEVTITIHCNEITLSSLPPMVQGAFYDQIITATPSCESYRFTAPERPNGVKLEGKRLYGTPQTPGPYIFTVTAEGTISGCTGSRTYHLRCPRLKVVPTTLPDGKVGIAYPNVNFTVTEGTAPYVFAVSSGALPPGLSLSSGGTLSGTPTAAGAFAWNIRVTDVNGCTTDIPFCGIDIDAGSCPGGTITLSPSALPAATPGEPYLQAITAAGGTLPYTFSVSSGALPPGLALIPVGTISGVPTEIGCFEFTITAIDANGCRGSVCYVLCAGVAIPAMSPWMLFAISILLAGAGWIAIGRR